jgi:MSHA biogenesis protein MshK
MRDRLPRRSTAIALAALFGAALTTPAPARAEAMADPTRPPLPPAATVPAAAAPGSVLPPQDGYHVESIVFGATRRLAVVNGHPVHERAVVDGARVVRIERNAVVLDINGVRSSIGVYESVVRKRSVAGAAIPTIETHETRHD